MAQYTDLPARYIGQQAKGGPRPAVLLHGFTQTSTSWGPLLPYLSGIPLVLPDLPGHGGAAGVEADLWTTADLLSRLVQEPATWVGYSMGGRTALHVALAHPDLVSGLVLVSATAGIEDEAERERRRVSDESLARRAETEGLEAFLEWWLSQPLFATLPPGRADRQGRLTNKVTGLASSLRLAGTGRQSPLWDRLAELGRRDLPVLCVAGQLDTKYCATARALAEGIGRSASTLIIDGAGHACHLERPELVGPALADFARGLLPLQSNTRRQQQPQGQLRPARSPQHGDEGGTTGTGPHGPHR